MKIQQNWCIVAKVGLRGNFMALKAYVRKEERAKISDLRVYLDPKVNQSRTSHIINTRVEMNVIRNRQAIKKINKPRSCFFVKNNNKN